MITKNKRKVFFIYYSKLRNLAGLIEKIFKVDKNDFNCLSKDHERVLALNKITTTVFISDQKSLEDAATNFFNGMNFIKALVYKITKYKQSSFKNLLVGFTFVYYLKFFSKKKISRLANTFNVKAGAQSYKFM